MYEQIDLTSTGDARQFVLPENKKAFRKKKRLKQIKLPHIVWAHINGT